MSMANATMALAPGVESIRAAVQHNCNISDARSASDYTLCVYLLKMREFYRWEQGIPYGAALSGEAIGEWLTAREHLWESLLEEDFQPLEIDGKQYDPFDSEAINRKLEPHDLFYNAGYGNKSKAHFFLARLEQRTRYSDHRIYITSSELARDLTAPPAMSRHGEIFIRRESLRRMVWEKLEEWRWNQPENAMARAIRHYDFDEDPADALEQMTDNEVEVLALHELGEIRAGQALGEAWREMLGSFPRSRLELMARSVRDHLADCLSTLPALLERGQPASLHFYFANLSGMRKQIYPALLKAYDHWVEYGDTSELENQAAAGKTHWLQVAEQLVELHASQVKSAWRDMETLIERESL
jgi:hypothetical protein